ncbi:hypothetical protein PYCCODRAFT_1007572 [Trametes coccinea BRFM310]|uniref:Uncharacterized protein n=1 Tax=Trametes coccinea (strain BRFM310) TaxID=1353009 RepID=A0A1Y2IB64_TRAC3|nr:hypothetical protein PYCCODRAFT_1007572 [Trametes coccinea BRFM310]
MRAHPNARLITGPDGRVVAIEDTPAVDARGALPPADCLANGLLTVVTKACIEVIPVSAGSCSALSSLAVSFVSHAMTLYPLCAETMHRIFTGGT